MVLDRQHVLRPGRDGAQLQCDLSRVQKRHRRCQVRVQELRQHILCAHLPDAATNARAADARAADARADAARQLLHQLRDMQPARRSVVLYHQRMHR